MLTDQARLELNRFVWHTVADLLERHPVWIGDLFNYRRKSYAIVVARCELIAIIRHSVWWRFHAGPRKLQEILIDRTGDARLLLNGNGWKRISMPMLRDLMGAQRHTSFIHKPEMDTAEPQGVTHDA